MERPDTKCPDLSCNRFPSVSRETLPMKNATVANGPTLNGLRTLQLENRFLRVVLLPEAGAKIWQITYKPLAADLLWNRPGMAPARHGLGAAYDDVWSGGWDELFPTDEAGSFDGRSLPDHGELWTGEWHAAPFTEGDAAGIRLRFSTPVSLFDAEKTILLRPEASTLELRYRLTNQGQAPFPFLFKLHPAFAVSASHRIDFAPMTVVREPDFPGTLGEAPLSFPWPYAPLNGHRLDLRQVPEPASGAVHFFYGDHLRGGWCGVTNCATGLAAGLRYDPQVFSSCWLFATHGGWLDLNVAVLEPATGYPFRLQSLIESGRARWLAPGETLETSVLFSAQQGLKSIGGVEPDGHILPGDEA